MNLDFKNHSLSALLSKSYSEIDKNKALISLELEKSNPSENYLDILDNLFEKLSISIIKYNNILQYSKESNNIKTPSNSENLINTNIEYKNKEKMFDFDPLLN